MATDRKFIYGFAIYDRRTGEIDYHIDLPMDGVEGSNILRFLASAAEHGWELCAAMRSASLKGSKLAYSPQMAKLMGKSSREIDDPDEISDLIFKKYL